MGLHIALFLGIAVTAVFATEPCDYMDTVNITNAQKYENGSYLYDGILLGPHEVAEYSYVLEYKDIRVETAPHMRGCVCLKRPCIIFCCPWRQKWNETTKECIPDPSVNNAPMANITIDGKNELKNVKEVFTVQALRLHQNLFAISQSMDPFVIYKNGSVYRESDQFTDKNNYCLLNLNGEVALAKIKLGKDEYAAVQEVISYAQLVSIPFMILTVCIYFYLGEVHNNYMKLFICYLIGLIIGYFGLTIKAFAPEITYHEVWCKFSGYTSYYFFMLAFFSINAISYDIWHNFRGTRRYVDDKKFAVYALYIFGTPLVFLMITVLAQELTFFPEYLKPGMSAQHGCWLNNSQKLAPFIVFFAPILLIILANSILFLLTGRRIHRLQRKYATTVTTRSSIMRHLRKETARYRLFLRLFILMAILWIFEFVAFFAGQTIAAVRILWVTNIFIALQGVLIFLLFVLRKPVRRALLKKFSKNQYFASDSEESYTTNGDGLARKGAAELLNLRDTGAI